MAMSDKRRKMLEYYQPMGPDALRNELDGPDELVVREIIAAELRYAAGLTAHDSISSRWDEEIERT